jgi:hypothetical protein
MSAFPAPYRKPAVRRVTVLTPFIRHVNTGALAFVMFVALALLSTTHGKDSETRGSAPSKVSQGSLEVSSATDEFNDGDLLYYPHSSYSIYTTDGKLFKSVENHISRNDEIPEVVALPAGSYIVDARSEKNGHVRVPVIIKAGKRTILDLELAEKERLGG